MRQLDLFGDLFAKPAAKENSNGNGAAVTETTKAAPREPLPVIAADEEDAPPVFDAIIHSPTTDNDFEVHSVFPEDEPALVDEPEDFVSADISLEITEPAGDHEKVQPVIYSDGIIKVKMKVKPAAKPAEPVAKKEKPDAIRFRSLLLIG